jgi:hypothetical protein
VTGYGIDGQMVGVRVPAGARVFASTRSSNRFWGQLSPVCTRDCLWGVKTAEVWTRPITSD